MESNFNESCCADVGQPVAPDLLSVPRIIVKQFKKHVKAMKIYSIFSKFGTITYLLMRKQNAVIEFSNREAVDEVLKCKFLKIDGSCITVESLRSFCHSENTQLEFSLDPDIDKLNSVEAFNKFVSDLHQASQERRKPQEDEKLCRLIEQLMSHIYPNCKVYPFGSRISGLCLPECDLDMFLDCGNMYDGNQVHGSAIQEEIVNTACKLLLRNEEFTRIEKVLNARVPILKFYHSPSQTHGDIAFRHGLGCENTKLLKFLQLLDNRLQPFVIFLKEWAYLHNVKTVNNLSHFTSYSLIMMAVMFLQQLSEPILPPISSLMKLYTGECKVIAGWDCSFITNPNVVPKTKNSDDLLQLIHGFFNYYRSFDFERYIICPYRGEPIPKDVMLSPHTLSQYFPKYIENCERTNDRFRLQCAVCVQDPFEHSHNLTRNVKDDVVMNFVSACGLTYELLSKIL